MGGTTFLDLLEHLTDNLADGVLVLATARHDLLETRPGWGQSACTSRITLEGLSESEAGVVVDNLLGEAGLPDALRNRITRASGGNPLFVEQMLSMLIDDGLLQPVNGGWRAADELPDLAIPPSIHALLAARLDRLVEEERSVLEPAAVIGVDFPTPAVTDLAPPAIQGRVASLLELLSQSSSFDRRGLWSSAIGSPISSFVTRRIRRCSSAPGQPFTSCTPTG